MLVGKLSIHELVNLSRCVCVCKMVSVLLIEQYERTHVTRDNKC